VAQRLALDAILVDPDEMQVIGKDDVLRQALVADDLVGFQHLVEIFADGLVLDIAENQSAFCDLEIGSALVGHALDPAGAVVRHRLQERLKRRTVRVLRLLINGRFAKRKQIAVKDDLFGH
jgi:hypothetical protein